MSLQPEYFCSWCHEKQPKETSTLKTCSRCGLVKYCGRECQRADYQDHKYTCREIKKYSKSGIGYDDIPEEYAHPNAGAIEEMESQYAEEAAHYIIGSICFAYAEKNDSYYAYEKAKEEFEKVLNPPWNDYDSTFHAFEFLTFIHLNLGDYTGLKQVMDHWHKNFQGLGRDRKPDLVYTAAQFAIALNDFSDVSERTTKQHEAFEDALATYPVGSSEERFLNCEDVYEVVERMVTKDIEDASLKCFDYLKILKKDKFKSLQRIIDGESTEDVGILSPISDDGLTLWKVAFGYFDRHPEFKSVSEPYFKAFDEQYEKNGRNIHKQ